MTPFVVATFSNLTSANAATGRLAEAGFERCDISVHEGAVAASNETTIGIDEALTGGLVGNVAGLLQRLFKSKPDGQALTYFDAVRAEGAILTVKLGSHHDAEHVLKILHAEGAVRVARLPQDGLET